jgi:hypothetical protein
LVLVTAAQAQNLFLANDGTFKSPLGLTTSYTLNVQAPNFSGGAKGDCTTDDAPAIQAAINAAASNATVLFPPPVVQALSAVTISIASPAVITLTASPYVFDQPIIFSTTGSLPTGLTAGLTYYVQPLTANTFNVATFPGNTPVNTSGTQTGAQSTFPLPCYLIKSGLTLGNGSGSASSTIQNVTLRGDAGLGGNQALDAAARNVRIMWGGASGSGTMLTVNGPISRRIVDLTFDGAFRANIGLQETGVYNSYDRLAVVDTLVTAWREIPITTLPTGVFIGSCANYHDQSQIFTAGTNNTTGIDFGATASSGSNFDICGETWNHITSVTNSDAGSSASIVRGADNIVFLHPVFECSSGVNCNAILVSPPTGLPGLPTEVIFQGAVAIGKINTPNNCATWNPAANANHVGLYFEGLMQAYSAAAPPSDSCSGAVSGTFTDGRTVGMVPSPLQFAATADGATLVNSGALTALKTYAGIPANSLRVGDIIRIRAAGLYTASNANAVNPTLALSSLLSGAGTTASSFSSIVLNVNQTAQGWNFESDVTVRTIGATGSLVQGFCTFNIATYNALWCENANAPPVTLNTTVANNVTVQAQWSVNPSATSSITLKSMTVEVIHPANNG